MTDADSKEFLLYCASSLFWSDLSEKSVLDIGCAEGRNSTYRLVELYPKVEKVIGIDKNPNLIEEARSENMHLNVEYHVADIESWPTLTQWEGQMNVIVSHYCFNCLEDKRKAFENMHRLLVPGGTAGIIFTANSNFYDWEKEIGEIYSQYAADLNLQPHEFHEQNYGASHYEEALREIGFIIIECEDVFHNLPFRSDLECKHYLGSLCPIQEKLPLGDIKSFQDNALQVFLKHSPKNEEGFTSIKYQSVKILIRKPPEKN